MNQTHRLSKWMIFMQLFIEVLMAFGLTIELYPHWSIRFDGDRHGIM